jgi:hypothetical protein
LTSIQLARGREDVAFAEQLRVDLALRQRSVRLTAFSTGGARDQPDSVTLAVVPDERTADYDAFLIWVEHAMAGGIAPVLILPQQNDLPARIHSRAAGIVFSKSLSYDEVFEELFRNLVGTFPPWLDVRVRPSLVQNPTGVTWWSDDLIAADGRFEHAVRISPNDSTVVIPGLDHPQHISVAHRRLSIANRSADEILTCGIVDNMATDIQAVPSVDGLELRRPHDMRLTETVSVIADTGNSRVLFRSNGQPWRTVELESPLQYPGAVCVDSTGFWIADTAHHRIVKCATDGRELLSFGGHGDEAGRFARPVGILRWRDLLFVAEESNDRLQVLDVRETAAGTELIPRVERLAPGFIGQPLGLSVNSNHRLAVSDRKQKCIWLIDLLQWSAASRA